VNLPNKLTLLRIFLIPLILLFLIPIPGCSQWNAFLDVAGRLIAFFLFLLAALTDLVDGHIARKHNMVTNLGRFLDPIADKILVISVLLALVQFGRIHVLIVILVVIRELSINGIRLIASERGHVIAAGNLGKAKTVSQIVAILILLAEKPLTDMTGAIINPLILVRAGDVALIIAVVLTLVSGFQYLWVNRHFLEQQKES
jgi:CDP-diacylglycerol---glycerol-3-phosphate 3-phosphatidyltransferase